jgi:hypothetical protein
MYKNTSRCVLGCDDIDECFTNCQDIYNQVHCSPVQVKTFDTSSKSRYGAEEQAVQLAGAR